MKRKILLLEDDILLAQTLIDILEDSYSIEHAKNGLEALEKNFNKNYDLYLLDINVPRLGGDEFLRHLREKGDTTPAIFITSYNTIEKLKEGFAIGADDYIKKPFDTDELLCRIEAVLKRYFNIKDYIELSNECRYDFGARTLYKKGSPIYLPPKILKLLELLIKNHERCTTNEEIINHLWHPSEEYSTGSIRIYINKIRNVIGKEKIINVKGEGYILMLNG